MSTFTTLELLTLPADVLSEAEMEIEAAIQKDTVVEDADSTSHSRASTSRLTSAFSSALARAETEQKAHADIRVLADTVRSIRGSFDGVMRKLAVVDSIFLMAHDEQTGLALKWRDIFGAFERTLRSSVALVPMAITMMNGVKDLLGNAAGKTQGDLKSRLEVFMKSLKDKEAEALRVKGQFQDVVDRLRIFWTEVERALADPLISILYILALQALHAQVHRLKIQIQGLQQRLAALQSTIISQASAGGVAAAMTISQLCPSAFASVMTGAVGSGSVGSVLGGAAAQNDIVQAEIAKTQREILELLQQQTTVTMHQQVLEDPKRHVDAIAIKLDAVVMIWQTINLDMFALHSDLSRNLAADAPVTSFYIVKMKVAKEIYGKLSWMLERYVEEMRAVL